MDVHPSCRGDFDGMVLAWRNEKASMPWHRAPERGGDDSMMQVIGVVLEITFSSDTRIDASDRLQRAAAAHGDLRRVQGIEESLVFGEYRTFGIALWDRLRETTPIDEAVLAVTRLDDVLRMATSAAMQGYHGARPSRSRPE